MPDSHAQHSTDEMTPALRVALVELGVAIPTTPQEVQLAEAHLGLEPARSDIDAAFATVRDALDDPKSGKPFMRLAEAIHVAGDNELTMAARKGSELDAGTLEKIERDVTRAIRKPQQS